MTGVVTSNRCGTCRKRKVKCDEAKPVCGPCRKGDRMCENPVSKVKFVDPKLTGTLVHRSGRSQKNGFSKHYVDMPILKYRLTQDGATFQTLRMSTTKRRASQYSKGALESSRISQSPTLSSCETLQLILLETFHSANPGLRLDIIAPWILDVPRRLPYSPTLEDATACLVQRRISLLGGNSCSPTRARDQASKYAKALLSLQTALSDPEESLSENTLCAVAILGHVELLGGGALGGNAASYITHAGGSVRLMQVRGPSRHSSGFSKLLLAEQRGPAIVTAIIQEEDCFMNLPEWRSLSFDDLSDRPEGRVINEVMEILRYAPSLVRDLRRWLSFQNDDGSDILKRAQTLRRALQGPSQFATECLVAGTDVVEKPSASGDEMFPTVYQFASKSIASACAQYWSTAILLDTIIGRLLPPTSPPSAFRALSDRCISYRQHICMSFEYARQFWPLGSMYISGPLIWAYHGATTEERAWIMAALWKVGEHIPGSQTFWGPVALEVASQMLFGEPVRLPVMGHRFDGASGNNTTFSKVFRSSIDGTLEPDYRER